VELTPRGNVIGRKVEFYCEDGQDTNGCPITGVPSNELAEIKRPLSGGRGETNRATVHGDGEFGAVLPADVAGRVRTRT